MVSLWGVRSQHGWNWRYADIRRAFLGQKFDNKFRNSARKAGVGWLRIVTACH
jgi:hypothetical protein